MKAKGTSISILRLVLARFKKGAREHSSSINIRRAKEKRKISRAYHRLEGKWQTSCKGTSVHVTPLSSSPTRTRNILLFITVKEDK